MMEDSFKLFVEGAIYIVPTTFYLFFIGNFGLFLFLS